MEKKEVKEVTEQEKSKETLANDDNKVYKILSYIWILWIAGLFVKNDKSVRFHVGQGMLITILDVAVAIINALVSLIGLGILAIPMSLIVTVTWGFSIGAMVFGIVNAAKGKDEEIPIIGKFAFYK